MADENNTRTRAACKRSLRPPDRRQRKRLPAGATPRKGRAGRRRAPLPGRRRPAGGGSSAGSYGTKRLPCIHAREPAIGATRRSAGCACSGVTDTRPRRSAGGSACRRMPSSGKLYRLDLPPARRRSGKAVPPAYRRDGRVFPSRNRPTSCRSSTVCRHRAAQRSQPTLNLVPPAALQARGVAPVRGHSNPAAGR